MWFSTLKNLVRNEMIIKFVRHHTGKVHLHVRPYYLHMPQLSKYLICAIKPSARRRCIETLGISYLKWTPLPRLPTIKSQALSVTGLSITSKGFPSSTTSQTDIHQRSFRSHIDIFLSPHTSICLHRSLWKTHWDMASHFAHSHAKWPIHQLN